MILKANKKNLLSILVLFILSSIVISGIAIAEDTEEEEPIVSEPESEWWFNGFVTGELQSDSDVVINFELAFIDSMIQKDTSQMGSYYHRTAYTFSGTCGKDVDFIYLYNEVDSGDGDWFDPFVSPEDFEGIVKIEPSNGEWCWVFSSYNRIDQEKYDLLLASVNYGDNTISTSFTLLAMATTGDLRYNYDTISFKSQTTFETPEDPPLDDPPSKNRPPTANRISIPEGPPEITLIPIYSLSAVLALAAIMLLLLYLYWR